MLLYTPKKKNNVSDLADGMGKVTQVICAKYFNLLVWLVITSKYLYIKQVYLTLS